MMMSGRLHVPASCVIVLLYCCSNNQSELNVPYTERFQDPLLDATFK